MLERLVLPPWLKAGLTLALIWLVPRLVDQMAELVAALPGWLAQGEVWLDGIEAWAEQQGIPTNFGNLSSVLLTRLIKLLSQLSQRLLGLLGATVGLTVNTVFVLMLSVFLLIGGETISAGLAQWLPKDVRPLVVNTINSTFRGCFAGQVALALILCGLQILVFTLLGIPYGVLFAVTIGFTTLVPYASALTIVLVSALLVLNDPRIGLEVLVAAITVGQLVDQVIQPRLMGSVVGLHRRGC